MCVGLGWLALALALALGRLCPFFGSSFLPPTVPLSPFWKTHTLTGRPAHLTRPCHASPPTQACAFCSTGRMGLLRSLALDEILVQVKTTTTKKNKRRDWDCCCCWEGSWQGGGGGGASTVNLISVYLAI